MIQPGKRISTHFSQSNTAQRGSILLLTIVTLLVVTIIGLTLLSSSSATFQQGRRQPRLTQLQALADGGAQYGYWKYAYGNVVLPYVENNHPLGPGSFSVTVSNNNAALANTIKVVSTATINSDVYAVTKVYNILTAPTNPNATASVGAITVAWTAVSGATSYNVYRSTSAGGEGTTPFATGITTTSYRDMSVTAGTTYYYEVTALAGSETAKSTEVNAVVAPANNVVAVPSPGFFNNTLSGEDDLYITSTQQITALTVTVTVARTAGLTYANKSNTFPVGDITQANANVGATVRYTYTLVGGKTPAAGTYEVVANWNLTGTAHASTGDTYAINVTAGGVAQVINGAF